MSEQNMDRSAAFDAAIMLYCLELHAQGGPTPEQWARLPEFSQVLAERADVMLFGGGKKGEAADMFNKTCFAVACLSFVPGGITFMGRHYESSAGEMEVVDE